jgi:hypothetical protein
VHLVGIMCLLLHHTVPQALQVALACEKLSVMRVEGQVGLHGTRSGVYRSPGGSIHLENATGNHIPLGRGLLHPPRPGPRCGRLGHSCDGWGCKGSRGHAELAEGSTCGKLRGPGSCRTHPHHRIPDNDQRVCTGESTCHSGGNGVGSIHGGWFLAGRSPQCHPLHTEGRDPASSLLVPQPVPHAHCSPRAPRSGGIGREKRKMSD